MTCGRHPFYKALITHQLGKGGTPLSTYRLLVKRFKIPVMRLMKCNLDGHDFAQAHLTMAVAAFESILHQLFMPHRFKKKTEIIDTAK
jgi:hypothetical protein